MVGLCFLLFGLYLTRACWFGVLVRFDVVRFDFVGVFDFIGVCGFGVVVGWCLLVYCFTWVLVVVFDWLCFTMNFLCY